MLYTADVRGASRDPTGRQNTFSKWNLHLQYFILTSSYTWWRVVFELKPPRSFEVIESVREYFMFWILKWLNVSINGLKLRNFRVLPYELSRNKPKLVFIQFTSMITKHKVNLLRQVTQQLVEIWQLSVSWHCIFVKNYSILYFENLS